MTPGQQLAVVTAVLSLTAMADIKPAGLFTNNMVIQRELKAPIWGWGDATFDYTGSGLMAKGGKLQTFAIAGPDKTFVWADAAIERRDGADCVVVQAAGVKEPIAVRYAWADNPAACNLDNTKGFPASPLPNRHLGPDEVTSRPMAGINAGNLKSRA